MLNFIGMNISGFNVKSMIMKKKVGKYGEVVLAVLKKSLLNIQTKLLEIGTVNAWCISLHSKAVMQKGRKKTSDKRYLCRSRDKYFGLIYFIRTMRKVIMTESKST